MSLPLPPKLEKRLTPAFRRAELIIRDWEWTWTKAGIFGLLFGFAILVTQAIVPSWFLYFANQKLRWTTFWLLILRDAIATGWIGTWFAMYSFHWRHPPPPAGTADASTTPSMFTSPT